LLETIRKERDAIKVELGRRVLFTRCCGQSMRRVKVFTHGSLTDELLDELIIQPTSERHLKAIQQTSLYLRITNSLLNPEISLNDKLKKVEEEYGRAKFGTKKREEREICRNIDEIICLKCGRHFTAFPPSPGGEM